MNIKRYIVAAIATDGRRFEVRASTRKIAERKAKEYDGMLNIEIEMYETHFPSGKIIVWS